MNTLIDIFHAQRGTTRRTVPFDGKYSIAVPNDSRRALARGWMWLGLLALIGSGVFSLLLVLARTPIINSWLPGTDFFRVALVVHVDLSVLVWFVALAGMLWSLNNAARTAAWGWFALAACCLGAFLMALSAFFGTGEPIMANYIPVLDRPLFLFALVLFGFGATVLVAHSLWAAPKPGPAIDGHGALQFGLNAAAVSGAVAIGAFAWSFIEIPMALEGKAYYEILFWGGGHALQFTWTLLMLVGWLALASASGARLAISPRITVLMFVLALLAVFVTPYAYLAHDVASVEHRALLTWAMRIGGGLAIAPIALAVVLGLLSAPAASPSERPLRAALVWSITLFVAGGAIGIVISGANVRIPAHYHGCIVGVTLALMGLAYHLLPRLGYASVDSRMAAIQPAVYGVGQLMHITGLVWSGGYGVQRKVAGADQVLHSTGEIAGMGLMGLGGLVAIVGGLLFVVVVLRALRSGGTTTVGGDKP